MTRPAKKNQAEEKQAESFWQKISRAAKSAGEPLFVMAPLANVTDAAFRQLFAKYSRHLRADGTMGGADVTWTEFVSADGLCLAHEKGRAALMRDLVFSEAERPIVAQLFTSNPEHMEKAAALAAKLGFDGIDINMGCPDRGVEAGGAGAAMMKNPPLAREVIRAAKRGASSLAGTIGPDGEPRVALPVSVKTRIGYNKNELETWFPELLAEEPAVLTVHARTRKEMSDVPARWEHVKRAVEIRNELQKEKRTTDPAGIISYPTLIFGNGDALTLADAKQKAKETGADGVMIGRGMFGNPWFFDPLREAKLAAMPEPEMIREKLTVMLEHTKLFEKLLGDLKNFAIMKKHYKAYVHGWDGAKELRVRLMETESSDEVEKVVTDYLSTLSVGQK